MGTCAERIELARLAQLQAIVPEVFGPGTLLYIGASVRRAQFLDALIDAGRRVTIVEAYVFNARHYRNYPGLEAVVCGDVRDLARLDLPHARYAVAFWWHGPEHVRNEELPAVLGAIEACADLVVLGCPWGVYPQAEVGGNRYERHIATLEPDVFHALGYRVDTLGRAGGRSASNILAVKRRSSKDGRS